MSRKLIFGVVRNNEFSADFPTVTRVVTLKSKGETLAWRNVKAIEFFLYEDLVGKLYILFGKIGIGWKLKGVNDGVSKD